MFSGVAGYEHSQASETLLYDVPKPVNGRNFARLIKLTLALLPPLKQSGTILGTSTS
jgi:autoinducer 2 (AI-2) kinase